MVEYKPNMSIFQQILLYITSFILAFFPSTGYTEGVVGQPQSFLPHQAVKQNDKTISSLIYRGLFTYDIYGNLVPDLAESWRVSNEDTVYTIKLKDNQYWSDGTKITSDDLLYTAFKVPDLQGVATDKVDDLTVRYTLPNKFSPFLSMLTVGVMQANAEEESNPLLPVSSGPFRILNIQRSGPIVKEITLLFDRPESAVNAQTGSQTGKKIEKLHFRYYGNEEELVTASKLGEIQGFLAENSYDTELSNFYNYKFPLQGVYFAVYFNLTNEKFTDLTVRQNIETVTNIEEIAFNRGITVQGPISRSPYTDQTINFDRYDSDYRADLENLAVTITVPDLPAHVEEAELIKKMWEDKLNMQVTIFKVDPDKIVEEVIIPRNYEILLYGQEISRDPDRYVNWHSAQKEHPGLNLAMFEQVRADRALEEGRGETDNDERLVHYSEFQKVVMDEVPAIFLFHPYKNFYVSKFIEGIGEKYTFSEADRFLDFENWTIVTTN